MSCAAPASTSKQAEPASTRPLLKVLADERVYILETHFDAQRRGILSQTAGDLGANVTTDRTQATVIVVNPRHATYRQELESAQRSTVTSTASQPLLVPHHWLAACRIAGTKVDPASFDQPVPYFVISDQSGENQPVRAWVSVNIHRGKDAGPHEAKRAVQDMLELGGCVITEKRSVADLLVVDKASKFYEGTVLAEIKNNSRTWQRIVERDWVESCVKQGKMQWPARGATERDDAADSMEEEDATAGKGPGRPKGKPRIEYSPEDDDFLCRYLAAWHPDGSWLSRKTFEIMVKRHAEFPMVDRHSAQSWHERFKKNSGALSNRVNRYLHAGIREKDLKTAKEVEKSKQAEASASAAKAERTAGTKKASTESGTKKVDKPGEGSSKAHDPSMKERTGRDDHPVTEPARTVAEREGARLTQIAAQVIANASAPAAAPTKEKKEKKQLVNADLSASDDDRGGPSRRRKIPTAAQGVDQFVSTEAPPTNSEATVATNTSAKGAHVTPASADTAPATTQSIESAQISHKDVQPLPAVNSSAAVADGAIPSAQAVQAPNTTTAESTAGPLKSAGESSNGQTPSVSIKDESHQGLPQPQVVVSLVTVQTADEAPSNVPDIRNHQSAAEVVTAVPALALPMSPRADSRSPKKVRLDIEASPERQILAGSVAVDAPRAHFLVRDLRDITKPTTPRQSLPIQLLGTPDRAARPRFSTPTSTPHKRSLMQDHMLSSEMKKRRRSQDPLYTIDHRPDVVLASTRFPPARIQDPTLLPDPPVPRLVPPPPITQEERNNRILSGQAVALRHRDEYKRHVTQLCDKYGIAPRDVSNFVNGMPKRRNATGELYWRDVDVGLSERYGREV